MTNKPCIPAILPITELDWQRLVPLIGRANREIARFDGTLRGMINPEVLMTPLTSQEAVISSLIEGTQVTLAEVLEHDAGVHQQFSGEKRDDLKEITNYRRALKVGVDYLVERPITLSLIKELHAILMDSVRGRDKDPGKFRIVQNWIGPKGCLIGQARFVPPEPLIMNDHLHRLQSFMSTNYDDVIIQMALIHAQFEIIHPFSDGNGRLGRMLIPLFFHQKNILAYPVFYLSNYLEKNNELYRDKLLNVTKYNDWQGWVEFFLKAVIDQAVENIQKAESVHSLYEEMKTVFQNITHSQFSTAALDAFFSFPMLGSSVLTNNFSIPKTTASKILGDLRNNNIIYCVKEAAGRNAAVYVLPDLINAVEGKEYFKK